MAGYWLAGEFGGKAGEALCLDTSVEAHHVRSPFALGQSGVAVDPRVTSADLSPPIGALWPAFRIESSRPGVSEQGPYSDVGRSRRRVIGDARGSDGFLGRAVAALFRQGYRYRPYVGPVWPQVPRCPGRVRDIEAEALAALEAPWPGVKGAGSGWQCRWVGWTAMAASSLSETAPQPLILLVGSCEPGLIIGPANGRATFDTACATTLTTIRSSAQCPGRLRGPR
jgi:hypothetical protein